MAGSQRVVSQGKELRVVELRGWLRALDPGPPVNKERWGGDWHYGLEVDPLWADQLGIDLNKIMKVGNIAGDNAISGSVPKRRIGRAIINVEFNAVSQQYATDNLGGADEPLDWTDVQDAWGTPVRFPFYPLQPPNSAPLRWVRMFAW